jgi:hypothetical protein
MDPFLELVFPLLTFGSSNKHPNCKKFGLDPITMDWKIGLKRPLLPNKNIAWALLVQRA